MPFPELPPQVEERVICSISAAVKYEVPANIVLAVAEKEGGKPGQWVRNSNGTYDVGPMQFNTGYLAELARYGITASDVAASGCYSFELATWRLRRHIRYDKGDLWTRAANYHSRTSHHNKVYRADLMRRAAKWADWLEARYVTYDMTKPDATVSSPSAMSASAPITTSAKKPEKTEPRNSAGYVPRQSVFDAQR
jgi:hypothetical protein